MCVRCSWFKSILAFNSFFNFDSVFVCFPSLFPFGPADGVQNSIQSLPLVYARKTKLLQKHFRPLICPQTFPLHRRTLLHVEPTEIYPFCFLPSFSACLNKWKIWIRETVKVIYTTKLAHFFFHCSSNSSFLHLLTILLLLLHTFQSHSRRRALAFKFTLVRTHIRFNSLISLSLFLIPIWIWFLLLFSLVDALQRFDSSATSFASIPLDYSNSAVFEIPAKKRRFRFFLILWFMDANHFCANFSHFRDLTRSFFFLLFLINMLDSRLLHNRKRFSTCKTNLLCVCVEKKDRKGKEKLANAYCRLVKLISDSLMFGPWLQINQTQPQLIKMMLEFYSN